MRVSATAKYIRRSTRKTRLVTQAIVGKRVEEAAAILRFMPQGAAKDVAKVLKSAAANAENNHDLSPEDLVVVEAQRRRGTHDQAHPAARPGACVRHPQADDPHHRRGREPGGLSAWVTRSIPTASGSVCRAPGTPSGTPTATTPTCSRRT